MNVEPKNKTPFALIVGALLVAFCCFSTILIAGVGITGLGFFTSPWIILLGITLLLIVLWISYQKYRK